MHDIKQMIYIKIRSLINYVSCERICGEWVTDMKMERRLNEGRPDYIRMRVLCKIRMVGSYIKRGGRI